MPIIAIRIPQLGEGLQEALLQEFLKKPGDTVKRDQPIYVMETDKATTDVECPYDGKIVEWTVEPGTVLEIGSEIGRIEVAEGVKEMPAGHHPDDTNEAKTESGATAPKGKAKPVRSEKVLIPPKTRKYLKEKGLLDIADQIPATGTKLMPQDVDDYLAAQGDEVASDLFESRPLPKSQITLNYRLARGSQGCVPVTVMNEIDWTAVAAARVKVKEKGGGPTGFGMACWCVVQVIKKHEKFRSSLSADGKSLKVFHNVNLGVAVALPGDEMVTAVVQNADTLDAETFFDTLYRQIKLAREGTDQADGATTLTVSNIGKAGMRIGIPAIVSPAVATLALGETYSLPVPDGEGFKFRTSVMATLSFDHRVANGVGAANFMSDVKKTIENFEL